jgi:hypothetical protein
MIRAFHRNAPGIHHLWLSVASVLWLLSAIIILAQMVTHYSAAVYGVSSLLSPLFKVALFASLAAIIRRLRSSWMVLPLTTVAFFYLPQILLGWVKARGLSHLPLDDQLLSIAVLIFCSLLAGTLALTVWRHARATGIRNATVAAVAGSGLFILQLL